MGIGDVDFPEEAAEWPRMGYRRSAMHEDDESSLATDEVDEQLEEGIDDEGLCKVSVSLPDLYIGA